MTSAGVDKDVIVGRESTVTDRADLGGVEAVVVRQTSPRRSRLSQSSTHGLTARDAARSVTRRRLGGRTPHRQQRLRAPADRPDTHQVFEHLLLRSAGHVVVHDLQSTITSCGHQRAVELALCLLVLRVEVRRETVLPRAHGRLDRYEDDEQDVDTDHEHDRAVVRRRRPHRTHVAGVGESEPVPGVQYRQELGQHGDDGAFAVRDGVDAAGTGEVERRRRGVATDDDQQPVQRHVEDAARRREPDMKNNDEHFVTGRRLLDCAAQIRRRHRRRRRRRVLGSSAAAGRHPCADVRPQSVRYRLTLILVDHVVAVDAVRCTCGECRGDHW